MYKKGEERPASVSYGEVLGKYLAVVNEISVLLDYTGRPDPAFEEEYEALRAQKRRLLTKLEQASREQTESDIQAILDEAFENQNGETSAN